MKFPRRLYRTATGTYCEEDDPKAAYLVGPKGMEMPDLEAERLGLLEYFTRPSAEAKEQRQDEPGTEDKAVHQDEAGVEDKSVPGPGLHFEPESRRIGGNPRGRGREGS